MIIVASTSFDISKKSNTLNSFITYFPYDNPQFLLFIVIQNSSSEMKNNEKINNPLEGFKVAPLITKNIGYYELYPSYLVCDGFNEIEWKNKILYLLENYDNVKKAATKVIIFINDDK